MISGARNGYCKVWLEIWYSGVPELQRDARLMGGLKPPRPRAHVFLDHLPHVGSARAAVPLGGHHATGTVEQIKENLKKNPYLSNWVILEKP